MNTSSLLLNNIIQRNTVICRCFCNRGARLTNCEVRKKRNELFGQEKARQMALITRVEKIQVEHKGPPEHCTLLMNKHLSTPFNCAMHIQELLMTRSVAARVNGRPWDMHRPLVEDCELEFLHFKDEDPGICNDVFWRSCSFLLGYVLETAFKDDHYVELCSFPKPNVKSGSFVYDTDLKLPDWTPTTAELNCLSRIASRLQHDDKKFERLDVDASVAMRMFEDNRFKSAQIPSIAGDSSSGSGVTLYRMGEHVDISRGPLMASTQLLGRFSITGVHDITSPSFGGLKRVQGLAIPSQIVVHYWTYELLAERAAKLNRAPVPMLYKQKQQVALES